MEDCSPSTLNAHPSAMWRQSCTFAGISRATTYPCPYHAPSALRKKQSLSWILGARTRQPAKWESGRKIGFTSLGTVAERTRAAEIEGQRRKWAGSLEVDSKTSLNRGKPETHKLYCSHLTNILGYLCCHKLHTHKAKVCLSIYPCLRSTHPMLSSPTHPRSKTSRAFATSL